MLVLEYYWDLLLTGHTHGPDFFTNSIYSWLVIHTQTSFFVQFKWWVFLNDKKSLFLCVEFNSKLRPFFAHEETSQWDLSQNGRPNINILFLGMFSIPREPFGLFRHSTVLENLTKFLPLSLRVDVHFETFVDDVLPLENSSQFLPILFIL